MSRLFILVTLLALSLGCERQVQKVLNPHDVKTFDPSCLAQSGDFVGQSDRARFAGGNGAAAGAHSGRRVDRIRGELRLPSRSYKVEMLASEPIAAVSTTMNQDYVLLQSKWDGRLGWEFGWLEGSRESPRMTEGGGEIWGGPCRQVQLVDRRSDRFYQFWAFAELAKTKPASAPAFIKDVAERSPELMKEMRKDGTGEAEMAFSIFMSTVHKLVEQCIDVQPMENALALFARASDDFVREWASQVARDAQATRERCEHEAPR